MPAILLLLLAAAIGLAITVGAALLYLVVAFAVVAALAAAVGGAVWVLIQFGLHPWLVVPVLVLALVYFMSPLCRRK
jgi:hypothetical protein